MTEAQTTAAVPESNLAVLRGGGRVWAIGAIHGDAARLRVLHGRLKSQLVPGDQLVYLGGYLGCGSAVVAAIDEILLFRRAFIAQPGVAVEDVVFLRGAQEEIWQKLLQLQFAVGPADVLRWMLDRGVGPTIAAYGGSADEGLLAAEQGVLALTRWTGGLRQAIRQFDGHTTLLACLKHAAYTDDHQLLFVHAGIDPARPLGAQRDHFWWGLPAFEALETAYLPFRLVVRGYLPAGGNGAPGRPVATLDGGAGRGGPLIAACFGPDGDILQVIEG